MTENTNGTMEGGRLTAWQLTELHTEGVVLVEDFFAPEEIAGPKDYACRLFESIAPDPSERLPPEGEEPRVFPSGAWFDHAEFPYANRELNLIGCHPILLAAARAALKSANVQMHYNYVTAKFTGHQNYSQPLHLDSPMHSFFLPSLDPRFSALNCVVYLSDVDASEGPLSYLPRSIGPRFERGIRLDEAGNEAYSAKEVLAVGPAGSVLFYFHDVYHRGTSLRKPGGARYQLVASYHAAEATAFVGGAPWPSRALTAQWADFLPHASVEQLSAIGFPPPGHAFWTREAVESLESRIPGLTLRAYREALPPE